MSNPLQQEFENLRNDPAYKPFQRLLSEIEPYVKVAEQNEVSKETAQGLLEIVKTLREEIEKAKDSRTSIGSVSGGVVNSEMLAGVVNQNQASRDVINIFMRNIDKIELPSSTPETIKVPVVLAVMTNQQAQELLDLTAFTDRPSVLCDAFRELQSYLDTELAEWQTRYGTRPEEWRPFGSSSNNLTIEELIADGFEVANVKAGFSPKLSPQCIDIQELKMNRFELDQVRQRGCIMIVDIVSVRHPSLQYAYHSTMLDASSKTCIVTIAPTRDAQNIASRLAVVIQITMEEMEFFKRQLDKYGEADMVKRIDDMRDVEQLVPWIHARVRSMREYHPSAKNGVPNLSNS